MLLFLVEKNTAIEVFSTIVLQTKTTLYCKRWLFLGYLGGKSASLSSNRGRFYRPSSIS